MKAIKEEEHRQIVRSNVSKIKAICERNQKLINSIPTKYLSRHLKTEFQNSRTTLMMRQAHTVADGKVQKECSIPKIRYQIKEHSIRLLAQ